MNLRTPRLILIATLLGTASGSAEEVPRYELKTRSSFSLSSEQTRAPFWPIGWVKRAKGTVAVETVEAPKITIDEKSFKVTSILLGSPSLAVINGRAYSEGEFLRLPKSKEAPAVPTRVRVQRISDGRVVLQHQDQMIVASLDRPALSARKAEELLTEDER